MAIVPDGGAYIAPCEVCGKTKEGNYTKYSFLGFELMVMVCVDCNMHIRIAGVTNLQADIEAFREQLGTLKTVVGEDDETPIDDRSGTGRPSE